MTTSRNPDPNGIDIDGFGSIELYPFIVVTANRRRRYWAEDSEHAVEQHIDAFGDEDQGDEGEGIVKVIMDIDALPDADEEVQITLRVADAEILRLLIDDISEGEGDFQRVGLLDERITDAHLTRIDTAVAGAMIG